MKTEISSDLAPGQRASLPAERERGAVRMHLADLYCGGIRRAARLTSGCGHAFSNGKDVCGISLLPVVNNELPVRR